MYGGRKVWLRRIPLKRQELVSTGNSALPWRKAGSFLTQPSAPSAKRPAQSRGAIPFQGDRFAKPARYRSNQVTAQIILFHEQHFAVWRGPRSKRRQEVFAVA